MSSSMRTLLVAVFVCKAFSAKVSTHVAFEGALVDNGSTLNTLRNDASSMYSALSVTEADAEMGTALGMDLALVSQHEGAPPSSGGDGEEGPATLAEYCAGPTPAERSNKISEGTKVKANWEGYGTMYPGRVEDKNSDGTVDIHYDDGFTEKNVKASKVKVLKSKKTEKAAKAAAKPRDDPACKLQEFLKKLQDQLKDLNRMISQWVAAQRSKIASSKMPPPPPDLKPVKPAAAPSAAPPGNVTTDDKDKAESLEDLKKQLADRDEYIKELEKQAEENNKALEKASPAAKKAKDKELSPIDKLIASYKAQIAERDRRIEELLQLIRDQEQELARLGAAQISLQEIDDAVRALEKDVEKAKKKRDELKKDGTLDPELQAVIDEIIKALAKLRKKVDHLVAMEKKAEADREAAEREAEEAAEAARKKAEEEGKDPDEAAAEAAKGAKKKADEKIRKADMETMQAAQEVSKEMKEAEKGATKLDTGLHPHGDKWWRYRYEFSYIESLIMIFIAFVMLLWSTFMRFLKHRIHVWALPPGAVATTHHDELEDDTHGTVYKVWLQVLGEQMMVCILTFLTVWIIAKTPLAEYFPILITGKNFPLPTFLSGPSEDMRVPQTGEEYRRLALDICTIFFFAQIFYFTLMFPVAHDTRSLTTELETLEEKRGDAGGQLVMGAVPTLMRHKTSDLSNLRHGASESVGMGSLAMGDFSVYKRHFSNHVQNEIELHDDPDYKELSRLLNDDLESFPLSKYLKVNIRSTVVQLFTFSYAMWLPVIATFFVFMFLHRFFHMGYVRIMSGFCLITLAIILTLGWFTKNANAELTRSGTTPRRMEAVDEGSPQTPATPRSKSIHEKYPTEVWMMCALQFSMFFVCYGVARMICQPWMWELHFWPVLILSFVALLSAILFVWLVSPAIPSFCGAMALPPYVDDKNMKMLLRIAGRINESTRGGKSSV